MTIEDQSELYDKAYYETGCGSPYEHSEEWTRFFGSVADAIVKHIRPTTVLDAGCAMGFLVEALRERGVEAYGIDISKYAISQVPESVKPYCWVGSITEPLPNRYDLIVSIEVLEHLQPADVSAAIKVLCGASDDILFSSTPDDVTTPTHFSVQPPEQWVSQFASQNFWRDVDFDASFITPWAMRFRKSEEPAHRALIPLERKLWAQSADLKAQQQLAAERMAEIERLHAASEAEQQAMLELTAERQRVEDERALHESAYRSAMEAMEAMERRLSQTQAQLNNAVWQLQWLDASRGVRMVKLARASRALLRERGLLSLSKRIALWSIGKRGYYLKEQSVNVPVPATKPGQGREYKQVMFLSGCPGDAMRYRCEHQVEQLRLLGCSSDFAKYGEVDLADLLDRYQCFIFHRVPYGDDIQVFMLQAKQRGKPVIFETDDLVFDPSAIEHIAALEDLKQDERDLYLDGVKRYRSTLLSCAAATVSTESLREQIEPLREIVTVTPNVVSKEMVRRADMALSNARARPAHDRVGITIAYFSGTPTHNRDFAVAQDAILWALEKYPLVRFKVVGHLRLDQRFDRFGQRVERVPLQPWQLLPDIYATVDISIAPLEPNNLFTESKSNIKYLEAALVRVPTIASPRRDFVRVIEPGVTGLLAETDEEWRDGLQQLIESPDLRKRLGDNAFKAVRENNTTLAHASREYEMLRTLYRRLNVAQGQRKLRINWVIRAPIVDRGGGYRTIFRLANSLGSKGHTVRVYVEPNAHLEGKTDNQIKAFIEKHFGPQHVQVYVGHDHILPADATIATNWPTAYTVAEHQESLFKFYFVQDFEPEFYEPQDHHYRDAKQTYMLPLQHVSIGSHLNQRIQQVSGVPGQTVDFAIDSAVFNMRRRPEDREGAVRVLFFARPGLKRRGFELGVEALRRLKERLPEIEIYTFGSTDGELGKLPFAATNLGVLEANRLAEVMNTMHILLTFSLSNISWVPFEGMACGMAVVEADVPSVREMVATGETCMLAAPEPDAVANALIRLASDSELRSSIATRGAQEMSEKSWSQSADQFERILLDACW